MSFRACSIASAMSLSTAALVCSPGAKEESSAENRAGAGGDAGSDAGHAGSGDDDSDGGRGGSAGDGSGGDAGAGASGGGAGTGGAGGEGATSGSGGEGDACGADENSPPSAPKVTEPTGAVVDFSSDLEIRASDFVDPDERQNPSAAEFEIWRLKNGEREERVWLGRRRASPFEAIRLSEGSYFGSAAGGALPGWKEYALRARYADDCSVFGAFGAAREVRADDGSDYLFEGGTLRDFYLEIPPESWDAINKQAVPRSCVPHHRDDYTATLRFEGQTFEGVGLHVKGGCGSARRLDRKAAFKVDLEWDDPSVSGCEPERRLYGQNSLTFNNMVQDPTFSHEWIAYRVHAALGLPVPRVAYVRLHINDTYFGLYLMVESFARRFLDRRFASKEGDLYEGVYGCDFELTNVPRTSDPVRCFEKKLVPAPGCNLPDPPQHELDHSALIQFVKALDAAPEGEFYSRVRKVFDFDRFLSMLAADVLVSHWDGYAILGQNFRVYFDPSTGRATLLESGFDRVFEHPMDPWASTYRLVEGCFAEPDCEGAFVERLRQGLGVFESLELRNELGGLQALTEAAVLDDPRKEVDHDEYRESLEALHEAPDETPARVRDLAREHGFEL